MNKGSTIIAVIIKYGLVILITFSLGMCFFYFNQHKIVFYPEKLKQDFVFKFSESFKEENLALKNGKSINYLVFSRENPQGVILYFHGNAGSLSTWGWTAAELSQRTNFEVWIMDYPGFGKSSPPLAKTEKTLFEMSEAFYEKIQEKSQSLPLVLFGRSIGSAIATDLFVKTKASGLILETPYTSLAELGNTLYPFLPKWFSRYDLNNERELRKVLERNVFIVHGMKDEIIPFSQGKHLSTLSPHFKFISIEDGGHNDLSNFPKFWKELEGFFKAL